MNRTSNLSHLLREAKGYDATLDEFSKIQPDAKIRVLTALTFLGKHTARAQGLTGLWDFVKEKLGYKEPKKSEREDDSPLPVDQHAEPSERETPLREIWKPGYRGRTDNKRSSSALFDELPGRSARYISNSGARWAKSETENEGLMSRLKKIFTNSSARAREDGTSGKMIPRHVESGALAKNVNRLLHRPEETRIIRYNANQRQMSLLRSLKAALGLNPRNTKPVPIREPNMPQKSKKDDKSKQNQKKPTLRTEKNSEEEITHVHSAMMDEHGKPVTEANFVRTEWGVRVKDQARKVDPHADALETIQKPFYFEKPLWGVNIKRFKTRAEAARVNTATLNSKSTESSDYAENSNRTVSSPKKSTTGAKNFSSNSPSLRELESASKGGLLGALGTAEQLFSKSSSLDPETTHRDTKMMISKENHPGVVEEKSHGIQEPLDTLTAGPGLKMPKHLNRDIDLGRFAPDLEIKAWKDVVERRTNRLNEQNKLLQSGKVRSPSVRPEPPESNRKRHPATGGQKPSADPSEVRRNDPTSKKLHTGTFTTHSARAVKDCKNDAPSKTATQNISQLLFTDNSLKATSGCKNTVGIHKDESFVHRSRNFDGNRDPGPL